MKVSRCYKLLMLVVAIVVLFNQPLSAVGGTSDKEQIIDVEKLKASLNEATSPISERINKSQLMQKFDAVNTLMQQKEVDKPRMLKALEELQTEVNSFTKNWSEITDPMFEAQDAIGQTVSQLRLMLARFDTGAPSERVKKALKNYDQRLSDLATTIKAEKSKERQKRLKMVFANVLALRELTSRAGMIDLSDAQQAVYVRIIESLSGLEIALTNSTFQVEKTRIILNGQAEIIGQHVQIIKGLIEHEKIARILNEMNSAGEGISVLGSDLANLNSKCEIFTNNVTALAERLSKNIDAHTSGIKQSIEFDSEEVNRKIEEYSSKQVK